jgi:Protein of unknown function (DUF3040)
MALSMEEQRILAEIEEQFTRTEPGLAARLAAFRGPRLATLASSPRARFAFSLAALIGVLLISVALYAFAALRVMQERSPGSRVSAPPRAVLTPPAARFRPSTVTPQARTDKLVRSHATAAADTARARRAHGGPAGSGR